MQKPDEERKESADRERDALSMGMPHDTHSKEQLCRKRKRATGDDGGGRDGGNSTPPHQQPRISSELQFNDSTITSIIRTGMPTFQPDDVDSYLPSPRIQPILRRLNLQMRVVDFWPGSILTASGPFVAGQKSGST